MLRIILLTFTFILLATGCSPNSGSQSRDIIYSTNGYELISFGGDSIQHIPQNIQLWSKSNSKESVVWPYVVNDPIFCGNTVFFNGGLTDDSKWKGYPGLLVFWPNFGIVEVSEIVTQRGCSEKGLDYKVANHAYAYLLLNPSTNNGIHLSGERLPAANQSLPESFDVTINCSDLDIWSKCVLSNRAVKVYQKIEYHVADGSECANTK